MGQVTSAKTRPRELKRFCSELLSRSVSKGDQSENMDSRRDLVAEPAGSAHQSLSAVLFKAGAEPLQLISIRG